MQIEIIEATIRHLKPIQKLNLALFEKEHAEYNASLLVNWPKSEKGEHYFRDRIVGEDGCAIIALVDEKPIGYVLGGLQKTESFRKKATFAELENMFVVKEWRSKGIGSQLYDAFIAWCREHGVEKVRVVAFAQNTGGINFYHKKGFTDYSVSLERDI